MPKVYGVLATPVARFRTPVTDSVFGLSCFSKTPTLIFDEVFPQVTFAVASGNGKKRFLYRIVFLTRVKGDHGNGDFCVIFHFGMYRTHSIKFGHEDDAFLYKKNSE